MGWCKEAGVGSGVARGAGNEAEPPGVTTYGGMDEEREKCGSGGTELREPVENEAEWRWGDFSRERGVHEGTAHDSTATGGTCGEDVGGDSTNGEEEEGEVVVEKSEGGRKKEEEEGERLVDGSGTSKECLLHVGVWMGVGVVEGGRSDRNARTCFIKSFHSSCKRLRAAAGSSASLTH